MIKNMLVVMALLLVCNDVSAVRSSSKIGNSSSASLAISFTIVPHASMTLNTIDLGDGSKFVSYEYTNTSTPFVTRVKGEVFLNGEGFAMFTGSDKVIVNVPDTMMAIHISNTNQRYAGN